VITDPGCLNAKLNVKAKGHLSASDDGRSDLCIYYLSPVPARKTNKKCLETSRLSDLLALFNDSMPKFGFPHNFRNFLAPQLPVAQSKPLPWQLEEKFGVQVFCEVNEFLMFKTTQSRDMY
jgi:hypothetical protein